MAQGELSSRKFAILHLERQVKDNNCCMAHLYGQLTSSNFARAISVMGNPHSTNIQRLHDELYAPKNVDHILAIKWGLDQESMAIDVY